METLSAERVNPPGTSLLTVGRVRLMVGAMIAAAVAGAILSLFWEGPDDADKLYTFAELAPDRDQWWLLLTAFGLLLAISVPLQAVLTLVLTPARGSRWASVGGVLMWIGALCQTAGLASWASAYYAPTDPDLGSAVGKAVFDAANDDEFHLYGLVPIGMGLVVIGTICQSVGLFRAKTVPTWVPIVALSVILIFLVPGFGVVSLISSVPMIVAAAAIGVHAVRRTSAT